MQNILTQRDQKILDYLRKYFDENNFPPSVREICHAVGINSTATVFTRLNKLEELGFIKKADGKKRAMEILNSDRLGRIMPKKAQKNIPLIGKIAAGTPISAIENIEDTYTLPAELFSSGELFMLKVQGNSMINAGIFDGDKIIVRKQETADNGEIVAAMIDGEATVKRFYLEKSQVRLQPENDALSPIIAPAGDVSILGVVVGLIRRI
jgi:repressor LexA